MSSLNIWSRRNWCGGRCNTSPPHHRPISQGHKFKTTSLFILLLLYLCCLCCTWTVSLHEPVLHLCISVYKSFCAAPERICLQEHMLHLCMPVYKTVWLQVKGFCATCMCLTPVYKSFVLHLDVSVYKSMCLSVFMQEFCAALLHLDVSAYMYGYTL